MNASSDTIRVAVDPTNPGQFFACCGLLELADRLSAGSEGWFAADGFYFKSAKTLPQLLDALVSAKATACGTIDRLAVKPIIAPLQIELDGNSQKTLLLDSWMRIGLDKGKPVPMGNSPWNFWSGQQTSLGIWKTLCAELKKQLARLSADQLSEIFSQRVLLSGRFGFDPGAAWDALDAGFSPNAQNMSVASSPAVELLAAVGIQRFRPLMSEKNRQLFHYALWPIPLAPAIAACAAATTPITPDLIHFRGQVVGRGQYAALGYSTQIQKGELHG